MSRLWKVWWTLVTGKTSKASTSCDCMGVEPGSTTKLSNSIKLSYFIVYVLYFNETNVCCGAFDFLGINHIARRRQNEPILNI